MSKLTALQEAMRIVEKYAPNLFNVYSQDSRDFLNEVRPYLEQERQQIEQAFNEEKVKWTPKIHEDGSMSISNEIAYENGEDYYNQTYGGGK